MVKLQTTNPKLQKSFKFQVSSFKLFEICSLKFGASVRRGFTLVELLVSIGIFIFITALVVINFGKFNSSTLLTNAAYDVALAIRTAQSYGVSVRHESATGVPDYAGIYSVDFAISPDTACPTPSDRNKFRLLYSPAASTCFTGSSISTFNLKRGIRISSICVGAGPSSCAGGSTSYTSHLEIFFKRPNPDSHIVSLSQVCFTAPGQYYPDGSLSVLGLGCVVNTTEKNFARITLQSADGAESRYIDVYRSGQITVTN